MPPFYSNDKVRSRLPFRVTTGTIEQRDAASSIIRDRPIVSRPLLFAAADTRIVMQLRRTLAI